MGGSQFTTEQNKALRELWAKESNPNSGQEILVAHQAGLTKQQVCRWFCKKRNQARARGEKEVTKNGPKNPNVAARMWYAYRYDPEDFVEKLNAGKIDPSTGEEIRLGEEGNGGGKAANGGEVNGGRGETTGGGEKDIAEDENGAAEKEGVPPKVPHKRKRDELGEKQLGSKRQKS